MYDGQVEWGILGAGAVGTGEPFRDDDGAVGEGGIDHKS